MLGLRFCVRTFSSCGKWGPLFMAVRRPLTTAASLVAEHRLQTRRLSSCGSRVQLLCGTWDLPRPGLEPVSPALAGRFSTTVPPGKPPEMFLWVEIFGSVFFFQIENKAIGATVHLNKYLNRNGRWTQMNFYWNSLGNHPSQPALQFGHHTVAHS